MWSSGSVYLIISPFMFVPNSRLMLLNCCLLIDRSSVLIGEGEIPLPNFRYGVIDSGTTLIGMYIVVLDCHSSLTTARTDS
jgi:hypothetical protein